jgi:hypothetical protein
MVDDAADQRHVPRPRQLGVGDAGTGPGGSVRGDDAVLNHQIRLTHPDAAPASLIGAAVADGQALEGDIDRVGSGAAHVEHPVQLPAVDDRGTCPRAPEQRAARDVEVAGGVGVVRSVTGQPVDAGRENDGVGAGVGIGRVDGLAERHLGIGGHRVEGGRDGECGRNRPVLQAFQP